MSTLIMSRDEPWVEVKEPAGMRYQDIVEGGVYVFTAAKPEWATYQRYRVVKFVLDVPSYQRKVLVEGLTGRDRGTWFVCSLENFRVRYEPFVSEGEGI